MFRFFIICLTTILYSGCIQLDEIIEINKNGSAKISITYSIPKSSVSLLKDSDMILADLNNEKFDPEAPPRLFDEKKIAAHFKKFKDVEIISLRVSEVNNHLVTSFTLQITDFRAALRSGILPYTSLEKAKDGYIFAATYPFNLSKLKENKALGDGLKKMSVTFKVKTPSPILETTGKKEEENLAVWSFSPDTTPFDKTDGKFSVKFDNSQLNFLDEPKTP